MLFIILGLDTIVQPHQKAFVHAAASDVTFRHTGNVRLLDALIRRKLPVGRDAPDADAPDADAPDAYYPYPFLLVIGLLLTRYLVRLDEHFFLSLDDVFYTTKY